MILRITFNQYLPNIAPAIINRITSPEKPNLMPAIKVNSNRNTQSMVNLEIEKKKDQIRTLASTVLEGQEQFLDVYLLELVRLQEAFLDEEDMA